MCSRIVDCCSHIIDVFHVEIFYFSVIFQLLFCDRGKKPHNIQINGLKTVLSNVGATKSDIFLYKDRFEIFRTLIATKWRILNLW